MNQQSKNTKTATLYRMVMEDHLCPYGLKAKDILERKGYSVTDNWLESKEQNEAFKQEHDVSTTPQVFIEKERIDGYDALREFFGEGVLEEGETTYRPVVVIFAVAFLVSAAVNWAAFGSILSVRVAEWFIALSMCILAIQKLRDVESFSTMFLNYDLLAKHWVRYGYVYPYGEAVAGILMLAGVLPWVSGPIALTIGAIGAASVIKAVYIDKRELKCACVGGDTNVPLGMISLTENVMMMLIGIWTLFHLA